MKRITWIKIHLYLSGVALVFMSLMALSGSIHLLSGDETESVQEVKKIQLDTQITKDQVSEFFANELKSIDSSYSYDYMKGSATSQTTRPTTRTYYTIKLDANQATIQKHVPTIRKSVMELHKGHGPKISRTILGILGLTVLSAVMSGLWLGWSSPAFRKTTILTVITGAVLYFGLFFA